MAARRLTVKCRFQVARGLNGSPRRYQVGAGRGLFTVEQRYCTDWYPLRLFNVGGAVFCDMGATLSCDPLDAPSQGLLRDAGFGPRLYLVETKKSF